MSVGFRLERQHLMRPAAAGSLVEVARRLGGLHAQVMSSADLQLRARVQNHSAADLPHALWEERTVVKTWLMRGTLHVVPAHDLPLFTGALDNRGEYAGAWLRAFDVTAKQMETLIDAIGGSLDGDCLTREELGARVEAQLGRSFAKRLRSGWGEFLKPAARRGVLCFGPSRGRVVGTWTHAKRGRQVELAVEAFAPLSAQTRAAVEREARSIARHVGGDLQLTWR